MATRMSRKAGCFIRDGDAPADCSRVRAVVVLNYRRPIDRRGDDPRPKTDFSGDSIALIVRAVDVW